MGKYSKIIILLIVIIGGYLFFYGNPFKIHALENDVQNYLIREKNYKQEDIQEVKGYYDWLKCSCYHANVKFKDEPNATYYYVTDGNGRIIQDGFSSRGEPLHEEK